MGIMKAAVAKNPYIDDEKDCPLIQNTQRDSSSLPETELRIDPDRDESSKYTEQTENDGTIPGIE